MIEDYLNVLLIEDNPDDAWLIQRSLRTSRESFHCEWVDQLHDGLEKLGMEKFDLVLMDLSLPDSSGPETFFRVSETWPNMPIVVLTGMDDESLAINLVKEGAQDYLLKGSASGELLSRAVRYALERKKSEIQIKASLQEKEILLREIHHRVKNNLQVISSLLDLEARNLKQNEAKEAFQKNQSRVRAMAYLHDALYESEDLVLIDFERYLKNLSAHILTYFRDSVGDVSINIEASEIHLDLETAMSCGLIVNEILMHSVKNSFPEGWKGEILATMKNSEETQLEYMTLSIQNVTSDSNRHDDADVPETLGMTLVKNFARKMKASMDFSQDNGNRYKFTIPMPSEV